MIIRACLEHMILDQLRTNDEPIATVTTKVRTEAGYEAIKRGHVQPEVCGTFPDAMRRIRAFWIQMHMQQLAPWDKIGELWMKALRRFLKDYKPSLDALVHFDHSSRHEMIELYRTDREHYPTIEDAATKILKDEWVRLTSAAFALYGQNTGSATTAIRTLTYAVPGTDSIMPNNLRKRPAGPNAGSQGDAESQGKKQKTEQSPDQKMQSAIDRGIARAVKAAGKGGKPRGNRGGWGRKSQNDWGGGKGRGGWGGKGDPWGGKNDWNGDRKGKRDRKGKKKGDPWKKNTEDHGKNSAGRGSGGGGNAGSPKTGGRRIDPKEFSAINGALKDPHDSTVRYCFQFNATIGCNLGAACKNGNHACIVCGANHAALTAHPELLGG